MHNSDFREYALPRPKYDDIADRYRLIASALHEAIDSEAALRAVQRWNNERRRLSDWRELVQIRFHQNTQCQEAKQSREYSDELEPKLIELATDFKKQILASPYRDAIAGRFGNHLFRLWECDIASFEPIIQDDLVRESCLEAGYTELTASAKLEFQGKTHTLSEMNQYAEHADRHVRHEAAEVRWNWFLSQQEPLDHLFRDLVQVRHGIARKLGRDNFVSVGYQRMHRMDYDQQKVEHFRDMIREHVVPLATAIRHRQAERLGVSPLMAWDEGLHDVDGNPRPGGDHDWMIDQARTMFLRMGHGMDQFFDAMHSGHLMDLKSREGKAGGGFCDHLPEFGMPFIFANFNGTKGDVEVFTHEMGHAFQVFSSQDQPIIDYYLPTYESCEIHSMGLEFLTWPHMELFFGEDAERFRRLHLTQSILFLPYGVAVDHFQHQIYSNPDCTSDDRARMWQEMERLYLPTLSWGGLSHPAGGRRWQAQSHIYGSPFYYIDYTLALTCALQLWVQSELDYDETLQRYVQLCRRGGEASFGDLVRSAGLHSPFSPGCLEQVVETVRDRLELSPV